MTLDSATIAAMAVVAFASFVGSTFGFGVGLISMPLLALFLPVKTATPLVGLVGITVVLGILVRHFSDIRFASAWRLVVSALAGIPVGLFLLKSLPDEPVKLALAGVILLFSLYRLFSPTFFRLHTERPAFLAGFLGGVLGGAYNTSGPPVVIYGTLQAWSPDTFRGTLQGFFLPAGGFVLVGHFLTGLWTEKVLTLYAVSLPGVALAILLGCLMNRILPTRRFDKGVYLLLVGVGLLLLGQTIWGMV